MKKYVFLFLLLVLPGVSFGDGSNLINVTAAGTNGPYQLHLIEGRNTGRVACITNISASASNFSGGGFSLYIVDGLPNGATAYQITQTTGTLTNNWSYETPLCLSPNTSSFFQIQSSSTYKVNIAGYIKKVL